MVAQVNTKIMALAEIQLVKDKAKYQKDRDKKMAAYQKKLDARGVVFEAYCFLVIEKIVKHTYIILSTAKRIAEGKGKRKAKEIPQPTFLPEPTLEMAADTIRGKKCRTKGLTMSFLSSMGCTLSPRGLIHLHCLPEERQIKVFGFNSVLKNDIL